jgi:hypothetical protein
MTEETTSTQGLYQKFYDGILTLIQIQLLPLLLFVKFILWIVHLVKLGFQFFLQNVENLKKFVVDFFVYISDLFKLFLKTTSQWFGLVKDSINFVVFRIRSSPKDLKNLYLYLRVNLPSIWAEILNNFPIFMNNLQSTWYMVVHSLIPALRKFLVDCVDNLKFSANYIIQRSWEILKTITNSFCHFMVVESPKLSRRILELFFGSLLKSLRSIPSLSQSFMKLFQKISVEFLDYCIQLVQKSPEILGEVLNLIFQMIGSVSSISRNLLDSLILSSREMFNSLWKL